jgi:endoglucanase
MKKKHQIITRIKQAATALPAMFLLIFFLNVAKSNPRVPADRLTAFKRARSLDNGVSVSWLEQTWSKDMLNSNPLKTSDYELMKKLGFKSIRLPVAFTHFEGQQVPLEQVLARVDEVWKRCKQYGFKLIVDYHYGNFKDDNYLTETPKIINLWEKLAKRYINESHDGLFFEIYNEPPHMDPKIWKDAAYNIVNAIHKVDRNRTLLVGASNFNSIYELSRFVRLADENVIYVFHFYEPFFFTHQGASWVGDQVATTGVSFPYNEKKFPTLNPKTKGTWGETNYYQYRKDGNERSVKDKLQIVKNWSAKYYVPVICGEYGVYKEYTDPDSRCRYIKAVRKNLKALNISGILWDYNSNFSIFNGEPAMNTLPDCMKEAMGLTAKK